MKVELELVNETVIKVYTQLLEQVKKSGVMELTKMMSLFGLTEEMNLNVMIFTEGIKSILKKGIDRLGEKDFNFKGVL